MTALNLGEIVWHPPALVFTGNPTVAFRDAPNHSPGTPNYVPSDCSLMVKGARIDVLWKALSEAEEWVRMVDLLKDETSLAFVIGMFSIKGRLVPSLNPLEYAFGAEGVRVAAREPFHVNVTLTDAVRSLIEEKATTVRVHLSGTVERDTA